MLIDLTEIKTQIINFVVSNSRSDNISESEDLFTSGHVSSLFAVKLIAFLEESFQISIEDHELSLDNFRSVQLITDFINQKRFAVST